MISMTQTTPYLKKCSESEEIFKCRLRCSIRSKNMTCLGSAMIFCKKNLLKENDNSSHEFDMMTPSVMNKDNFFNIKGLQPHTCAG